MSMIFSKIKTIKKKNQRGSVLVFTIIITGIMMATAMSLITASSIERKTSGATGKSIASFQSADTGIEIVLADMNDPEKTMVNEIGCSGGKIIDNTNNFVVTLYYYDGNDYIEMSDCTKRISEIRRLKSVGSKSQTVRAVQLDIPGDVLDGLVGWWKLDDNFFDSSPEGNTGTGTVNIYSDRYTNNKAAEFNGSSDFVSVNTPISATDSYSISFWFQSNGNSAPPAKMIFERQSTPYSSPSLEGSDSVGYKFFVNNNQNISTDTINTDDWYYWVGVWDDSTSQMKIYLNGSLADTASDTTDDDMTTLFFGSRDGVSNFFNGKMDDVRIYNRALTASEVRRIFNNTK